MPSINQEQRVLNISPKSHLLGKILYSSQILLTPPTLFFLHFSFCLSWCPWLLEGAILISPVYACSHSSSFFFNHTFQRPETKCRKKVSWRISCRIKRKIGEQRECGEVMNFLNCSHLIGYGKGSQILTWILGM